MEMCMKSFQISNITYDANTLKLTFEFNANGFNSKRIGLGIRTKDEVAEELKTILNQYYTVESE